MSPTGLTDAAITRMIRRMLTSPGTCSDTLLILADGFDEAAADAAEPDAARMLRAHAANLRHIAPYMAQTLMLTERAA